MEIYRHGSDIPLEHTMLVWTAGDRVGVVPHPDTSGLSDPFQSSVGACFAYWSALDAQARLMQFMIELWHVAAFYDIPAAALHEAALAVPEYRAILADDCLPDEFRNERE